MIREIEILIGDILEIALWLIGCASPSRSNEAHNQR